MKGEGKKNGCVSGVGIDCIAIIKGREEERKKRHTERKNDVGGGH